MKKTEPALWGADRKVCDDAAHPSDFPAVGDFVMAGKTGEGTQAVCQDHKNNGIRDHWNRRNLALSFGGNNRGVFRFFWCGKIHAGQPTA